MLVPSGLWCVSCGKQFMSGVGSAPPLEHVQCHSGLYGSNDNQLLCKTCSDHEEDQMDEKGNDIPELLKGYREDSAIKPPD